MTFSPGGVQNTFVTSDGEWLTVTSATPRSVHSIAKLLGYGPDELRDQAEQLRRKEELDAGMREYIGARTADEALRDLEAAGVVVSKIFSAADIVEDETYRQREDVIEVDDAQLGPVRMQAALPHLRSMPGGVWRTGPALGEDNELVYSSWLGVPPEELERLRKADVV
jgi:formyl-CoA transferase